MGFVRDPTLYPEVFLRKKGVEKKVPLVAVKKIYRFIFHFLQKLTEKPLKNVYVLDLCAYAYIVIAIPLTL